MKTQKLTTLLAALVLLSAAIAQEAEQDQNEKVSNTLTASCLVKVTCDPAILPLTFETVDYLMHSSGVAGRAAAEVLGPRDEPYEYEVLLSIEPLSVMPTTPQFDDRPKPAARPPTRRSRSTQSRPHDEGGLDERALEEMRAFERSAKFQRRAFSEEEEEKEKRRQAQRGRRTSRTPVPGKTVRGANRESPAAPPPTAEQTLLFRLQIDLECCEVKPAAEEFMNALISNLRETLTDAYYAYRNKLDSDYGETEGQRELARHMLSRALGLINTRSDERTKEQLKNRVDLSSWSPEMSFFDAINELKHSVDPPLKMVVLWGDLLENAEIDQTTPTNMDPLPEVRLSKALDFLLKSVASGTGVELGYEIDGGIITIATADRLPSAERRLSQLAHTDAPVEMLLSRKEDLFRDKQQLEMNIARHEAQQSALTEQIGRIDAAVAEKVNSDPIAHDLIQLEGLHTKYLEDTQKVAESGRPGFLKVVEAMEKLTNVRMQLEQRREHLTSSAGGNRLSDFNVNLTDLMIDLAMSRAEFEVISRQLAETEAQLKTASTVDPEISQIRLAQEELEIAERRLTEMRIRRANLREPTVTALGGI